VCKSSSGYSESCGKNNESENKQFISHVNNRDLLHLEILVNHTYLYNNYLYLIHIFLPKKFDRPNYFYFIIILQSVIETRTGPPKMVKESVND
jgi:hypothetical protein